MKKVFRKLLEVTNEEKRADRNSSQSSYTSTNDDFFSEGSKFVPVAPNKLTKLQLAVLSDKEKDVKKYVKRFNINEKDDYNRTVIQLAVLRGDVNIVTFLLLYGANIDIYDNDGLTPFLRAVKMGNIDLVKLFMNKATIKNQTDFNGDGALHLSIQGGLFEITELLLQNNFPVNRPNKFRDFPLHMATQQGLFSVVKLLIDKNAEVNIEDREKRTPLLIAVKTENVPLVELFLQRGANLQQKDVNGHSVFDYVSMSCNSNLTKLFAVFEQQNHMNSNKTLINDEDSQNSEMSITFPPILNSPKSWSILHPSNKNEQLDKITKSVTVPSSGKHHENIPKRYERKLLKMPNTLEYMKSSPANTEFEIDHYINKNEEVKFTNCRKALDRLSLDVLHECNQQNEFNVASHIHKKDIENNQNKKLSDSIPTYDCNSYKFRESCIKIVENTTDINKSGTSNLLFQNLDTNIKNIIKNESNKDPQEMSLNTYSSKKICTNECSDDSSDDEPLFWNNSSDGGYFTEQSNNADIIDKKSNFRPSHSDDERHDESKSEVPHHTVLTHLKQMIQENEDLETETAVLRESVEKLKYDFANSIQITKIKDVNLDGITSHLARLENKYSKAMEKINMFQLGIDNLAGEVVYLRCICEKYYEINQYLMNELNKTLIEDLASKSKNFNTSGCITVNDIQKMQENNLQQQIKYAKMMQNNKEKYFSYFEPLSSSTLDFELNKIRENINHCLMTTNFTDTNDEKQILIGKTVQQILQETENKLQLFQENIKRELENKFALIFNGEKNKKSSVMEFENMKQKLLFEVSKLNALLKEKEVKEEQLKSQLEKLHKDIRKSKDDRRKFLIRKSYEDDCFNETRKYVMNLDNGKSSFLKYHLENNLNKENTSI